MGRKYVRKTNRQSWRKEDMNRAFSDVRENFQSVNSTAKKYNIPEPTLRRYLQKYPDQVFPSNAGRFKNTFSDEQLEDMRQYIIDIDKRAFGLTKDQFSRIIFDYAEKRQIPNRFNKAKKKAGRYFVEWFMAKYKLSLRTPESTSIARLMAFNQQNVSQFFNALKDIKEKYNFASNQIYNLDETGISTVATKNPKVITPRGKRRVIKVSSAERGTNITAVCCMNASGNFIPPFLIFPRVRMQPAYMAHTPPGFVGVAHETGWMNSENFVKYLHHFIQHARPSENNRILLLMDNHASHVTLEAINLCRENFISVIGFPPHTSHRMQPLDVSLYGPLKTAYSRACDDFLTNNPGKAITLYDIASIFGKAYLKVATVANAISGFRTTGIEPFDSQIFTELDFETSKTTERDLTPTPIDEARQPELNLHEIVEANILPESVPSTSTCNILKPPSTPNKEIQTIKTTFGLPPLPQAAIKNRRCRKKLPSLILSSTPVKDALEEKQKDKLDKERKKQLKSLARPQKIKTTKKMQMKKNNNKAMKNTKRQLFDSSSSESSVEIPYSDDSDNDIDLENEEDDKLCLICNEEGKNNELWFRCDTCSKWAHSECTELNLKEAKAKVWVCDFCYKK